MRGLKGLFLGCLMAVFAIASATETFGEPVTLELKYPMGRKLRYKNKYALEYYSNRAELIIMSAGSMRVNVDGEWRSIEEVIVPVALPSEEVPEGTIGIRATINSGASRAIFLGERQTYEQYPFTLDLFNDRSFTWRITPDIRVGNFEPEFPAFKIDRLDLITDLYQMWVPNMFPVLPDKPVSQGDSWTGEHRYERPFASMVMGKKKALVAFKSTFHVKEIKDRKDRVEMTITENSEIEYQGWLDVSAASIYYGGKGTSGGQWVIDVTNGIVLEHKIHLDVDRPEIIKAGTTEPLSDVHAEIKIDMERKLEKIETK